MLIDLNRTENSKGWYIASLREETVINSSHNLTGTTERTDGLKPPRGVGYIRLTSILVFILAILIAIVLTTLLFQAARYSTIPFDTDEANHAVDGWEVYFAASRGTIRSLSSAVTDQGFYPPLHSFLVAASYWIFGPGLGSSRLPSVGLFGLAVTLLAWLCYRISSRIVATGWLQPWLPLSGAAFALLFAVTGQTFSVLAILVMLEMTGAVAGLLLLLSVDAADVSGSSRARWMWLGMAAVLAAATFLTKYSFGLFFIPALVAGLVSNNWPWKTGRRQWLEAAMVTLLVSLIIGFWVTVTDRSTMLLFFTDHPEYASRFSSENLLFLPRVWLRGYSSSAMLGVFVLGLAVWGTLGQWRWLAVRVAAWSVVIGVFVLTVSTTNEPRHMLPLAPALWFLAGLGIVSGLWRLHQYSNRIVAGTVLVLVSLILASALGPMRDLPERLRTEFEGDPVYSEVQSFALEHADLSRPVLFIGDFTDQNGLLAVRWLAATSTRQSVGALDLDYFPFETYEHSLIRTNRKPQIATIDPTFPRKYMNEVLARGYYATIVEVKHLENYYGPRAANPDDPLCGYPTLEQEFENWITIIYDVRAVNLSDCTD